MFFLNSNFIATEYNWENTVIRRRSAYTHTFVHVLSCCDSAVNNENNFSFELNPTFVLDIPDILSDFRFSS